MRSRSRLLMFVVFTVLAFDGRVIAAPPLNVKEERQIREALHWNILAEGDVEKKWDYLTQMGGKAFPVYEAILSDPKVESEEVARVLLVLCNLKMDRRRFLRHAISRLTEAEFSIRFNAVTLLGQIGSPADASPVVALLSDKETPIVQAAARSLAAIGGSREVVAMDVWLIGASYPDNAKLREHVQECRDKLKKRLDEARVKAQPKSRPAAPSAQQR